MSTTTTPSHDTGQRVSPRGRQREARRPVTRHERNASNRLRTMVARDFEQIQAAVGE